MKVYVLLRHTSYDYSESPFAVFVSKEEAKRVAALRGYDPEYDIEEYELIETPEQVEALLQLTKRASNDR